jgi:hypothetical protein
VLAGIDTRSTGAGGWHNIKIFNTSRCIVTSWALLDVSSRIYRYAQYVHRTV